MNRQELEEVYFKLKGNPLFGTPFKVGDEVLWTAQGWADESDATIWAVNSRKFALIYDYDTHRTKWVPLKHLRQR